MPELSRYNGHLEECRVQLAGDGDDVTDSSVPWPEGRTEVPFSTVTLTGRVDDTMRRGGRSSSIPSRGSMASTGRGTRSARCAQRSICSAGAGGGAQRRLEG